MTVARVFAYTLTHYGDPDREKGIWGVNDCMGKYRDEDYDAVIGLLNGKLSWVASVPEKLRWNGRGPLVSFGHFVGWPPEISCPALVSRLKNRERVPLFVRLLSRSTNALDIEIKIILKIAINAPPSKGPLPTQQGSCRPRHQDSGT
jgi:hypothetical protein